MIYRSKAPLRLGLAGGGTDVSPFSDRFGGATLNATIALYAHATLEVTEKPRFVFVAHENGEQEEYEPVGELPLTGCLDLLKAVYNCVQRDYGPIRKGFRLSTYVDAPAGSGLGTSSTLAVAILGVFAEMLGLPMGEYDLAHYAFEIERTYLKWAGGKQDQYAATFGGFNYMEFFENDQVIVNPLRLKEQHMFELENNLLLYFTSMSRNSSRIIAEQARNVEEGKQEPIEAMHLLKQQAQMMKEALLKGQLDAVGKILDYGFRQKQKMAEGISNPEIEEMYEAAKKAGATGGKISGAGGGGFLVFYCPGTTKHNVIKTLQKIGGHHQPYQFVAHGLKTWSL